MYLAQASSAWEKQFSSIKHEFLEAVVQRCSVKMVFLESSQNSQENTCAWVSFLIKKETLAQVFSYELCELSKNNFLYWIFMNLYHLRPEFL